MGLLATGVVGIVNFVFTIPAVLWVDQVGRKPMLIWGEFMMAVSHATIAAIVAVYGPPASAGKGAPVSLDSNTLRILRESKAGGISPLSCLQSLANAFEPQDNITLLS